MSTVPALPRPSKPHNRRSLCYNLRFLMITLNVHAPGGRCRSLGVPGQVADDDDLTLAGGWHYFCQMLLPKHPKDATRCK